MTYITGTFAGPGGLLEGMNINRTTCAGVTGAGVFGLDALAHLYWTTGATWPGADAREVSMALLDFEAPFTPPVLLPLAALTLVGAWTMLAAAGLARGPWLLVWLGTRAIVLAAFTRGVLGIVWAFTGDSWTAFYWLNLLLYTPLCLVLFSAAWQVTPRTSGKSRRPPLEGAHLPRGGGVALGRGR